MTFYPNFIILTREEKENDKMLQRSTQLLFIIQHGVLFITHPSCCRGLQQQMYLYVYENGIF